VYNCGRLLRTTIVCHNPTINEQDRRVLKNENTFGIARAAMAVLAACCTGEAGAQTTPASPGQSYPTKPVRMVIPFAPGGGSDTVGRMLAQKLGVVFGRQFVIDNRAGAGGRIAAELVAKSPADGYTLLFATSSIMATAPALYSKLAFDMPKDYAPISLVAYAVHVLITHPSVPVKTVRELIAIAKARPGSLSYSSSGAGGPGHLSGELFASMANIKWTHVPYKGSSPATLSVVAGETDLMFSNIVPALPPIRSKRVRAIGVGSAQRSVLLPDVPPIAESGLPGFDVRQLYGILAPGGTPREVVKLLNEATARVMQEPDSKERLLADGSEVMLSTPEQFERTVISEIEKWSRVIKQARIKAEE
jgi:tripartite-type tricarboxylate transporter receptor subunit TctC